MQCIYTAMLWLEWNAYLIIMTVVIDGPASMSQDVYIRDISIAGASSCFITITLYTLLLLCCYGRRKVKAAKAYKMT